MRSTIRIDKVNDMHLNDCITITNSNIFCRVLSSVVAQLVTPFHDRPNEGLVQLNVELSPMAAEGYKVNITHFCINLW